MGMMSKERELLMRWLRGEANEMTTHIPLLIETQNLLAQPEQEPINFDLERMKLAVESPVSEVTVEGLIDKVKSNRVFYQEGYAQAELDLKRERINHDDILDRSIDGSFEYRDGFMDGVMFAEKHHGIGGER